MVHFFQPLFIFYINVDLEGLFGSSLSSGVGVGDKAGSTFTISYTVSIVSASLGDTVGLLSNSVSCKSRVKEH